MRQIKKTIAKIGHAKAVGYRNGLFSAASDLEALVDAYGIEALCEAMTVIHNDLATHGDSIHNGVLNMQLNARPLPRIRKQNKPENKKRRS